jgi:chromosome segregation ATPase
VTGISDIGELVERFKAVEDQNFSLFNYVNEINNEIEVHAEETVEYQQKIDVLKVDSVAAEEQRKSQLKHLEHQLTAYVEKSSVFQKQDEDITQITGDLTKGIENLVNILQTIARQRPSTPAKAVLAVTEDGEAHVETEQSASSQKRSEKLRQMIDFSLPREALGQVEVTDANLVQFLGLIEKKSNELLTLNYIINSPKKVTQLLDGSDGLMPSGGVAGLLGQGPTPQIGTVTIVAPSTGYFVLNSAMIMIPAKMHLTTTTVR